MKAQIARKDISPCRLLFLDEAARLDARSIATLFELCERLQMQLIIAAPENISPEKGTTYKLVRKVFQNTEHVHVVGCADLRLSYRNHCRGLKMPPRRQAKQKGGYKAAFFFRKDYAWCNFFRLLYIRLGKTF
jgi:hypothetical protein